MSASDELLRASESYASVRLLIDSSGIGGIETHTATLCKGLLRRGIDAGIVLLKAHKGNRWIDQLRAQELPFEVLEGNLGSLLAMCRRDRPRLLHTHGYKASILGRVAGAAAGVPVVSTFHAGERARFPVSLYQRLDEWTSIMGERISVSPAIRDSLPFASTLIDNFAETPDAPPAQPAAAGIGFVGRLSHEKGPDLFCEAARKCGESLPWHIFGDGPMRSELEAAASNAIVFHGMISDVSLAWRQIGLLVVSSRAEGLPMAVIEAMGAGVPVAAARIGALPSILRDDENGWLFDAGNTQAIGSIVRKWRRLDDAQRQQMRYRAWQTAHERFGLDEGVAKTLAVYARTTHAA